MSLPLLVNGADCGPVNPLQSLSKTFDRDRGIQQDHFGAGRAGSSKEVFRSQYSATAGSSQDAARFFSTNQFSSAHASPVPAFDLAALHAALPHAHAQTPVLTPQRQGPLSPVSSASWASDFLQQPGKQSPVSQLPAAQSPVQAQAQQENIHGQPQQFSPNDFRPFSPMGYGMAGMSMASPPFAMPVNAQEPVSQIDASHWDREFQSQEAALTAAEQPQQEAPAPSRQHDGDELARIAGELVNTVGDAGNAKFKNSEFLGLMRQLRDGNVVVDGDKMVLREEASPNAALSSTDVKGKGRAIEPTIMHSAPGMGTLQDARPIGHEEGLRPVYTERPSDQLHGDYQESPIDAYLRQENEEYIRMQQEHDTVPAPDTRYEWWNTSQRPQDADWGRLQRDWDSFEATVTGIRPLAHYQFQPHNPYVLGEASSTHHHAMHSDTRNSIFESVLELEAAVQRDPTNASRWYELGVKQQENEREQKAVQALRRALELDPSHLPSWIAVAVSHTNESNRQGTYASIYEWVERNERYRSTVEQFRALNPINDEMTQTEKFATLIQCLIEMARGDQSGEIDADIQIALAVLLNTNEEYAKARDCFNTALAIRPDDWLLYNRVGATLANSGRPEDALQYYYRALELNPAYIRARFNLGISCINLRRYDEAAQHILDALSLQDSDSVHEAAGGGDKRGVTTLTLWESLKTCCLHMQRLDLANLCDRQDLEAFRLNFQLA
ncbi:TPR-like protein [Rhodofomes roseus]|uniref:TPR-like protein n=1 Tax=Rhodofomes roseus TaxID=34475 RepID=A0ABQ8K385_9APHY|nr:TPR-like protein [Rhodofomes roseus]KAH9831276.1 TPR-like protein [Rhodofomes roseus]